MNRYVYKDKVYTINELVEISGIAAPTLRDRLRKGYTVEQAIKETPTNDSVEEFSNASYYRDWLGMSTSYLHEIYWKWCISNGYQPLKKQGFMRHLIKKYPNLKTVPTKRGNNCYRVIRER